MTLTLQEVYNKAARGMLLQGRKSMRTFDAMQLDGQIKSVQQCAYRGDDGEKCGVGHCIDDQHYTPDIEGGPYNTPRVSHALRESGVPVSDLDCDILLMSVQRIHDAIPVERWRSELHELAISYGLQPVNV